MTVSDNSIYSNTIILDKVAKIIENGFYDLQCKLGQMIDYAKMLDEIY